MSSTRGIWASAFDHSQISSFNLEASGRTEKNQAGEESCLLLCLPARISCGGSRRAKGAKGASRLATQALSLRPRPGRGSLAAVAEDLAGPAAEASSLHPETDSPALPGGDGARAARRDPDAQRRRRWRGDTGEGWRKQERGLPKRGCGAQKEATAFP